MSDDLIIAIAQLEMQATAIGLKLGRIEFAGVSQHRLDALLFSGMRPMDLVTGGPAKTTVCGVELVAVP